MNKPIVPLGELIDETQERDAVYIAICPVIADETLSPGEDIGFINGSFAGIVGTVEEPIGIVDPFLKAMVRPQQLFLMMLYPNTTTSLRHDWTHPAFESVDISADRKAESIAWMEKFASEHRHYPNYYTEGEEFVYYTAEQIIRYATDFLKTGHRHVQQGSESLRDDTNSAEFWRHYEVVTGINPMEFSYFDSDETPFCCTC